MGSGITWGTTVATTPRHDGHGTPRGASRTPATTATGANDGLPDATVPGNHYFTYPTCTCVQVCSMSVCVNIYIYIYIYICRLTYECFAFYIPFASCPCYVQKQFRRYRHWLVNVARGNSIRYQKDIEGMCRRTSRARYICIYIVGDLGETS